MSKKIKSSPDTSVRTCFNEAEITIFKGTSKITLTRMQANNLVKMIRLCDNILGDCEAFCGEIIGMPE